MYFLHFPNFQIVKTSSELGFMDDLKSVLNDNEEKKTEWWVDVEWMVSEHWMLCEQWDQEVRKWWGHTEHMVNEQWANRKMGK